MNKFHLKKQIYAKNKKQFSSRANLNFSVIPSSSSTSKTIIMLHGLLGNLNNFRFVGQNEQVIIN